MTDATFAPLDRMRAALDLAVSDGVDLPLRAAGRLEHARAILAEHRESLPTVVAKRLAELIEEAQADCHRAAFSADLASGALHDEEDRC